MARTQWGDEIPDEYDARREGRSSYSHERNPYDNFCVSRAEEEAHDAWQRGHDSREQERREEREAEERSERERYERARYEQAEREREYEEAAEADYRQQWEQAMADESGRGDYEPSPPREVEP